MNQRDIHQSMEYLTLNSSLDELKQYIKINCPAETDLPKRANIAKPDNVSYQHLAELSDVVWLVVTEMVARQIRHHGMTSSSQSRSAIYRRLVIMIDLVNRLASYGVLSRQSPRYETIALVKKFLEINAPEVIW